ncbi:hypothetical protein [Ornithinimicrobium cerasi]|uniref:hypothetical protein n=1 Tax=Ornithinimicrobium cerasi TaxID=2248773 RepID=UPI00192A6D15|nr:hypothetical protein [Ornithinimicrobium cerasi]
MPRDDHDPRDARDDRDARDARDARDDDLDLVPVRRRPDLVRFLVTGAVIGGVLGGLIGFLGPDAPSSSLLQEIILLASTGAIVVGLLAAVLYLLVDRRSLGS